jgi:hypothetical protein
LKLWSAVAKWDEGGEATLDENGEQLTRVISGWFRQKTSSKQDFSRKTVKI